VPAADSRGGELAAAGDVVRPPHPVVAEELLRVSSHFEERARRDALPGALTAHEKVTQ
jgi:hypothetical protein